MRIGGKEIQDFEEADLLALVARREPESQTIEFKREMYGGEDASIDEMLKDITAMANCTGGAIFIGIDEENNRASKIVGIDNGENNESRIRKSCRSNVEEPLIGLETKVIHLQGGKCVLIIGIPEGDRKPYRVNFRKHTKFYKRDGTDNQPMSIVEIKELASGQNLAIGDVEAYFKKRRANIVETHGMKPHLVLSLLPARLAKIVDIFEKADADRVFGPENPYGPSGFKYNQVETQFTSDSIRVEPFGSQRESPFIRYEIFDNGYIELFWNFSGYQQVYHLRGNDANFYICRHMIWFLLEGGTLLRNAYSAFGIAPPYEVRFWTPSVKDLRIWVPGRDYNFIESDHKVHSCKESELLISWSIPDLHRDIDIMIAPMFRKLCRAFGIDDSLYFDKDGYLKNKDFMKK